MFTEKIKDFQASEPTWGEILAEVADGLKMITKGEFDLAKAEAKHAAEKFRHSMVLAVSFGAMAIVGILPLIAAAVIGLGISLDGRYWLSSLIVGAVLVIVGAVTASVSLKRLGKEDLSLPQTRDSLLEQKQHVQNRIDELREAARRRAQ